METELAALLRTAFVALAALLPITNPPGNAPIFLSLTRAMDEPGRRAMARRVGLNCLVLLVAAAYVGNYVLAFFDISLAVVRVGGGLLVAATAWRLLAAEGEASGDAPGSTREASPEEVAGRAFYPLSFPITVGPGSISIAITLGASLPARGAARLSSSLGLLAGIWVASLAIWLAYRYASHLVRLLGTSGTAVFLRLSAFILLCIGVQICWDGIAELLAPWRPAMR
ncbi:MAG: NAAT family transporter [Betaproteobacteria bacterium]|nr:NAAT family transporter [Betaproteobacteria bacterium]